VPLFSHETWIKNVHLRLIYSKYLIASEIHNLKSITPKLIIPVPVILL
jgi:hypothetical protein